MKSSNDSPAAPPMIALGGSPISVAVPPMFETMTSIRITGTGSMSSVSASRNVIGTISRIMRQVGQERREQRRQPGEADHEPERLAAGELAGADRDVVVDPALLRDVDQQHHPREQADRVEVDRLDRLVLRDDAGQDDDRGARQDDLGVVHALRRDQDERDGEDGDGEGRHAADYRRGGAGPGSAARARRSSRRLRRPRPGRRPPRAARRPTRSRRRACPSRASSARSRAPARRAGAGAARRGRGRG